MLKARATLRNAWRFLSRLARVLAVRDDELPERAVSPTVLLSCHDVDRSMVEGGHRYSPLLEGIRLTLEELGYATVNLTHPYAVLASAQVTGGTVTLNRRALRARLLDLLAPSRRERETRVYQELLQRLKPRIVIAIQPPLALCQAAKRCCVKIVEALHGTHISQSDRIFRDHMANPTQFLPDAFLAFDDVTQATYKVFCAGRPMNVIRAEDPWLYACRRSQVRLAQQSQSSTPVRKTVLITLQWGYDGERKTLSNIIPNGVLHPALEEAIALSKGRGITYLLRMHPIQVAAPGYGHHRRYLRQFAARFSYVEIDHATSHPLPLLLEDVHAHITMSSSALGEAAVAGVPSLALCPTLKPGGPHDGFFRELADAGMVTFGELDARAIVAWIERTALPAVRVKPPYDLERHHHQQQQFYAALIEWTNIFLQKDAAACSGTLGCAAIYKGTP